MQLLLVWELLRNTGDGSEQQVHGCQRLRQTLTCRHSRNRLMPRQLRNMRQLSGVSSVMFHSALQENSITWSHCAETICQRTCASYEETHQRHTHHSVLQLLLDQVQHGLRQTDKLTSVAASTRGSVCLCSSVQTVSRYLDKAHLPHSLLVVVVHLTHQRVAQVHSDPLDGLVLPGRLQDLQQQLVDPTVLELQLLWDAEVTQGQAAVPLNLWGVGGVTPPGQPSTERGRGDADSQ